MELAAIITLIIIVVAFILFATEKLAVDHVAIGLIVVFGVSGILTPEEALKGFSNSATLTVLAMFILGSALIKTGIIESIGPFFNKLFSKGDRRSIFSLTALVGVVSAFINNTPIVATSIPIVTSAANSNKKSPSKYLIPLSYGAILGGSCTLIGTSTNLLIDGIAQSNGIHDFKMFTFLPLGLVFTVVGILYLVFFSKWLLPNRRVQLQNNDESVIEDYITEIEIIGKKKKKDDSDDYEVLQTEELDQEELLSIEDVFDLKDEKEVVVRQLIRDGKKFKEPAKDFRLETGDILLVRGNLKRIKKILNNDSLEMTNSLGKDFFPEEETKAVEIVITPNSSLANKYLGDLDFFTRYNSRVLAIRQRGVQKVSDLEKVYLASGDVILIQTNEKGLQMLNRLERKRASPFLALSKSEIEKINSTKLLSVVGLIALVILLATFNIVPLIFGAFAGIFIMVLFGIITMEEAYKSVDWKVIFLLAGSLCLGEAMLKTGLSDQLAGLINDYVATEYGPVVVISILYLVTSILTETMSNNAAAALLAPIAISLSAAMDANSLPFLIAIAFAGSASFMTPIGYQTNTMVYSVGNYRFKDFIKIGLPLNLLFWILATLLIPVFYPF